MDFLKRKNIYFSTCFVSMVILVASSITMVFFKQKSLAADTIFVNSDGLVTQLLRIILEKQGIQTDLTLNDVVTKTQKSQQDGGWLRTQGVERWELNNVEKTEREWYIQQFKKLYFLDEIRPDKKQYGYAVIFGATIQGMRVRFAYLLKLLAEGHIHVDSIIFLVGQRPRDATKESLEVLYTEDSALPFNQEWQKPALTPQTETDLARLIIEQSCISDAIKNRIVIIDAPMIQKTDGSLSRPTTDSTVQAWLATKPQPKSVLCISSQPHVIRQLYVAERLLPQDWDISCAGPAVDEKEDINISVLLDTLARTLWELQKKLIISN